MDRSPDLKGTSMARRRAIRGAGFSPFGPAHKCHNTYQMSLTLMTLIREIVIFGAKVCTKATQQDSNRSFCRLESNLNK